MTQPATAPEKAKVLVIEMTRDVERKLPGGERQTLRQGARYTMDEATATPLLKPTKKFVRTKGALQEREVGPAATLITSTEVEADDVQAERAKAKADKRVAESEKAYYAEASLDELTRDLEAEGIEEQPPEVVEGPAASAPVEE